MPRSVLGWFVSVLLGTGLLPSLASAQEPSIAEALFRSGRQAMKAGNYHQACAKFRESNRLDPSPGTQLNLGECEEKLGRLATAWELYQRVVHALPPSDERQRIARADAEAVEPRVPRITLVASHGSPHDMEILNGDVRLTTSSLAVPIPVNPGEHEFVVKARGRHTRVYRVNLRPGERHSLFVAPGPAHADPGAARLARERVQKWNWGVTALGVAGAAFVTSSVSGIMVLRKKTVVEDPRHCDAERACDRAGVEAGDAGKTYSLLATISAGVGLAAAGAGVYLLLTRPGSSELRAGALMLPTGAALSLSSRY